MVLFRYPPDNQNNKKSFLNLPKTTIPRSPPIYIWDHQKAPNALCRFQKGAHSVVCSGVWRDTRHICITVKWEFLKSKIYIFYVFWQILFNSIFNSLSGVECFSNPAPPGEVVLRVMTSSSHWRCLQLGWSSISTSESSVLNRRRLERPLVLWLSLFLGWRSEISSELVQSQQLCSLRGLLWWHRVYRWNSPFSRLWSDTEILISAGWYQSGTN